MRTNNHWLYFAKNMLLLSLISSCPLAYGVLDLHVRDIIPVYSKPDTRSKVLMQLEFGDRVPISPRSYGSWKKVLITVNSKRRVGWVLNKDVLASADVLDRAAYLNFERKQLKQLAKEIRQTSYHQGTGVGIGYLGSFLFWGERSFELSDGLSGDVSAMTSTTFFPQLFIDFGAGKTWGLRGYVALRSTHFEGEATSDFIGSKKTEFEQAFFSLGLEFKFYKSSMSSFWWGIGAEVAQGQSIGVLYDGDQLQTSDEDLPFFFIFNGSVGYDFRIWKSLYMIPQIRIGTVANQDPMIYLIDGVLSLAYQL